MKPIDPTPRKTRRSRNGKSFATPASAPERRDNETANAVSRMTFLANLETGLSIGGAARAANVGRATIYRWRASDPEFARQWDEALESGTDEVEDALRKTALEGNVAACLAILKARRPEKYRDRFEGAVTERLAVNAPGDAAAFAAMNDLAKAKQTEAALIRMRQKYEPEEYRREQQAEVAALLASIGIEGGPRPHAQRMS